MIAAWPGALVGRKDVQLFLTSLLGLYAELLCIRWMPAHVRFLSYFTNFILLASFLGLGVGILSARRKLPLGPRSFPLLLLTAALSYLPGAYRISRSLAVNLNQMEYVQVARARGEGRIHIACVEILPNMIHPMLADFGLRFVFVVLLLSGLSFLGLGVQPPAADLGSLVRENISGLADGAPAVIMPALAIATLTIGVNLVIDSLPGRTSRIAAGALR